MSRKQKAMVVAFALVGILMPLRPLFFTKPTDPAAEPIDWFLTPLYVIGPLLPPMGDFGGIMFLLVAAAINATLYSLAARYVLQRFQK